MASSMATAEQPKRPYKKAAIPLAVRREVARRYGAQPGRTIYVPCHYCGANDRIWWEGPLYWPTFGHELDHVTPEVLGGRSTSDNLVLTCRRCNRSKGARA